MASVKDVTIRINVEDGDIKKTKKDFDSLNKSVTTGGKQMSTSMSSLKSNLIGVGAALGGLVALKAIVGDAAKRIIAFEKSISSLSAITGATGDDLTKLKGIVLSVASSTKKSATEIAKAFELVGSAQPALLQNADALALVTENAITLSKASGLDLVSAVNAVTTGMAQFNLSADESSIVMDALAAGAKAGASAIPETSAAIEKFGAVANSANITVTDSVALVETLADKQLKGAEAGNNLKNIILKLKNAGKGFVDGQFNINAALEQTKNEFDSIEDPVKRSQAQTKLFGLESATAGQILLDNIPKFQEFQVKVSESGVAMAQAVIQTDNLATKTEELDATYESFILSLEDGSGVFSEFAKSAVDSLSNVLAGLTDLNSFDFSSIFSPESSRGFSDAMFDLGNTINSITNPALAEQGELLRSNINKTLDETTSKFQTLTAAQLSNKDVANTILKTYVNLGFSAGEARDKYLDLVEAQTGSTEETEKNTEALDESTKSIDSNNKSKEKQLSLVEKIIQASKDNKVFEDDTSEDEEDDEDFVDFLASEGLSDEDLEKRKEALEIKQEQDDEAAITKMDSDLDFNELLLEQEQGVADAKAEINSQIKDSALGLASALIGLAGDSQAAQLAALAFDKGVAIAKVATGVAAANAIIVAEGAALAIPTAGASVASAAGLVAANNTNAAIQIATIIATAIPQVKSISAPKKLKDGEVLINGAGTETSDSIPAMLSKNESVINASSSKKHESALRAINDDRFEEYLNRVVMERLYMGKSDRVKVIAPKRDNINFPKGFRMNNARAISKPIVDAIEESNFLKGAGWD